MIWTTCFRSIKTFKLFFYLLGRNWIKEDGISLLTYAFVTAGIFAANEGSILVKKAFNSLLILPLSVIASSVCVISLEMEG